MYLVIQEITMTSALLATSKHSFSAKIQLVNLLSNLSPNKESFEALPFHNICGLGVLFVTRALKVQRLHQLLKFLRPQTIITGFFFNCSIKYWNVGPRVVNMGDLIWRKPIIKQIFKIQCTKVCSQFIVTEKLNYT